MITIEIGVGFFIGLGLTCLFLVSYLSQTGVANKLHDALVGIAARFFVALLSVPEVNESATNLIAGGINAWLKNPDAQTCINELISKTPKEEAARELGKNLPKLIGNFSSGVFHGTFGREKSKQEDKKLENSSSQKSLGDSEKISTKQN